MRALQLALRTLTREWRSGELGVLLLALTIAVAALTGVGFLVSRIGMGVDSQATEVLAADLRLESARPIEGRYSSEAQRRGIATAQVTGLLSVVFHGEQSQLANLHAVTNGYPLRGTVLIGDAAFGNGRPAMGIPAPGEAWPDSKLFAAIGASIGDPLSIGASTLRATRVLISRPDQDGTFADLAPSVVVNVADLPAMQLIQPGSRVRYATLFAADRARIESFKTWLSGNSRVGVRLLDVTETSPQIRSAIDRAGRFLSLASLVSVLLCSIAVAMAARRYVQRHLDSVALLKTLGATRGFVLAVTMLQLFVVALAAATLGAALGYATQAWLAHTIRSLLNATLPAPEWTPVAIGFVTALTVLSGFALPPLLQLARVPAIRVLRRDVGPPPAIVLLAFGPAVAAVVFLVYWVVRDWTLFLSFTVGLTGFLLLLALAGAGLVKIAALLRGRVGIAWRYGIANLSRRRAESVVQIAAFGLGFMVLLVLILVRNDLLDTWRKSLPANLPNYFFVNIPPADRGAFTEFLAAHGGRATRVLPMIRARLTAINGRPVETLRFTSSRGEGFATREQNLTWAAELGADNRIVAGSWWTAADAGKPLVSLATEFQESIGLKLGDELAFDVAGEIFKARVASVRKVKWDSFAPNFFVVFPPGVLEGTAGTYMTSAYFRPGEARPLAELVRRFPSVSIFDMDDLLGRVRAVIDKAALAVQSVFAFTMFAGLVVLLAAVQASRDERRYESAMLRTLGASRGVVRSGVLAEFATLGALAGLLAALGATLAGYLLATRLLELPYVFEIWVWIVGVCGGALLVAASGWLATRSAVDLPPIATLRGS
ncbi:MAG: FtsX-like permease family protein [Steroidobacteraceae bacterium]